MSTSTTHCIKMEDGSTKSIPEMLNCIERYNPDHLKTLEKYVEEQAEKNTYDLETNLAVLKLYQFNPGMLNMDITYIILLKALTNLPHTDFVLAKCLLLPSIMADPTIVEIINLADTLETCKFSLFWEKVREKSNKIKFNHITGFYDSIRKFVCHVVGITFQNIRKESLAKLMGDIDDNTLNQWIKKNGWKQKGGLVFIASQDENIKTKNITEKIEFDNLASIMAKCL